MLYHGMLALDLARERTREREREITHRRLAFAAGAADGPGGPRRRATIRSLLAGVVRGFGDAAHLLSHAATAAAGRIEGPAA